MNVRCCITGGGPAGMIAAYLLARAGVGVVVLEKHADFFRDFRGDTIHPSTLTLIAELGLLDEFLALPHAEVRRMSVRFGEQTVPVADFTHVPGACRFLALMPQWDFLAFLAERAKRLPAFRLLMQTEATGLLRDGDRITGVRAATPDGPLDIAADLVIAADGRHSTLRDAAGFAVTDIGAPIDILWLRLTKKPGDPGQAFGNIGAGGMLVMLDRGDYFQCALVIVKGGYDAVRAAGLPALAERIVALAPFMRTRMDELQSWDDVKLLTVTIDRLARWYQPGLLCIGDAAHAMSPVGGVGINLAIQDAVAAANLLARPLRNRTLTVMDLDAVQRRREFPVRATQAAQVFVQERFLRAVVETGGPLRAPAALQLVGAIPWLQRIPAYLVGIGVRPEHVRLPDATAV
jgi:2-polyprenyl-6-methoxyphenol hydroxylase-like FAD-dependent oxidoreductase